MGGGCRRLRVRWSGRGWKGRKPAAGGRSRRGGAAGGGSDRSGQGWGCPWPRPVAATFVAAAAVGRGIGRGSHGGLIGADDSEGDGQEWQA